MDGVMFSWITIGFLFEGFRFLGVEIIKAPVHWSFAMGKAKQGGGGGGRVISQKERSDRPTEADDGDHFTVAGEFEEGDASSEEIADDGLASSADDGDDEDPELKEALIDYQTTAARLRQEEDADGGSGAARGEQDDDDDG